jgi:hypothetical protein
MSVHISCLIVMACMVATIGMTGCDETRSRTLSVKPIELSEDAMKAIKSKQFLFGHQSVGSNILSGLKELKSSGKSIDLNASPIAGFGSLQQPGLYHFSVGRNGDPFAKIDDFAKHIRGGLGSQVDVAFFKFCYIDMEAETDTTGIFDHYRQVMEALKKEFPNVRFAHVTVPLVSIQTGPKAWAKKIIGMPLYGLADNYKRNEFNKLLVATYGGKDPIFDLAKSESTYADGSRARVTSNGKDFFVLAPEYTTDGGHLNETGRQKAAAEFLQFLASACN